MPLDKTIDKLTVVYSYNRLLYTVQMNELYTHQHGWILETM